MASGHGGARSGAGRKPGSRNRLTKAKKATLSDLAKAYTEKALATLAEVMESGSDAARVSAANSLLDRAYGKPVPTIIPPDDSEDDAAPRIDISVRGAVADVRVTKPQ